MLTRRCTYPVRAFDGRSWLSWRVGLLTALLSLVSGHSVPLAAANDGNKNRPGPGVVALVGVTAINPARGEVIPDAVVLLADGRIRAVGTAKDVPIPPGAELRDLHGKWLLPGYTDAHVHCFQSGGLYTRPDSLECNEGGFRAWG